MELPQVTSFPPGLAMLGAVLLWAAAPTGNKWVLADVSVAEVVAFRIVAGAVLLWSVGLALGRSFHWRGPLPLVMGILEPWLLTFFIVLGLEYTSAVNAAVIWGITPLVQPFLARAILKEPLQASVMVGAILAVTGVSLLFAAKSLDGTGSLLGDFFLLCAVASAAANQLIARTIALRYRQPTVVTAYQLLSASLLALVYLALFVPPAMPYAGADAFTYAVLCFLALATAAPFFLYNYALQTLSVGRISLFGPLSGPLGVVIATLAFGEPVDALIIVAILIALGGAFTPNLVALWSQRRPST
jgi:drug/metabolite transporter (DMT)-like permease